ncbi:C4-dicarboxylate transporter/malic acid transport protein [Penicillium angulare]|uniref:C4-dicarboxylate transporter/malic acid transport protein n=1 Tax=Penicillium angulare TaxID=116970 RepID=UPI00254097DF|nr:C4-dicarboxylate transporter/malic acid transport protein [Penicillium angulare]KAJ5287831.1 C4-dicarboxylate transporter/malic acid transport protein [Penicillium angulare]
MSTRPDRQPLQPPDRPLSLAIWNFTSQWLLIPQGTGIICVIIARLHYQFNGLQTLAKIVWIYTIVLFGLCLFFYLLRILLYPKDVRHQLRTNLIETSCLSCTPIAYTSILQLAILQYGDRAGLAIYILWWTDTAMAIIVSLGIPYIQLKIQAPGVQKLPPVVLLPFVAVLTSAAGGGAICRQNHVSARLQVPVIIVSYLEVGIGLAVTTGFNVIIMFQHFNQVHSAADKVFQDMIICGPLGQGAFALQVLGEAAQGSFGAYKRGTFLTDKAADTIGFTSQFLGLLTWGYGIFWWSFAILSICHTLGVFTNAAVVFGRIMDSPAFYVISTAHLLILLVMWLVNQILTLRGIITGRMLGLEQGRRRKGAFHTARARDLAENKGV